MFDPSSQGRGTQGGSVDATHALASALLLHGLPKALRRCLLCQACPRWVDPHHEPPLSTWAREMLVANPRCRPRPAQPLHFGTVLQYPQLRSSAQQCLQLSLRGQRAVHALISAVLAGQAAAQGTAAFKQSCETIFSRSHHSWKNYRAIFPSWVSYELQRCEPLSN